MDNPEHPEFVALIDFIPQITQLASAHPGIHPFLSIRSGEFDEYNDEFYEYSRATFTLVIEEDEEGERAYLLVDGHAELWHGDGPEPDWVETVSLESRHELGLYRRRSRMIAT
jgi:hypothetical protein